MHPVFKTMIVAMLIALATSYSAKAGDGDDMVLLPGAKASANQQLSTALHAAPSSGGGSALQLAGGFLFVAGILGGAVLLLKRVKFARDGARAPEQTLEVVERMSLGMKRELLLVRAGGRTLLLAALNQDVKLLAALPAPSTPAAAKEQSFEDLLSRFETAEAKEEADALKDLAQQVEPPARQRAPSMALASLWPGLKEN